MIENNGKCLVVMLKPNCFILHANNNSTFLNGDYTSFTQGSVTSMRAVLVTETENMEFEMTEHFVITVTNNGHFSDQQ